MLASPASPRVAVRRHGERGRYDRQTLYAILDEALYCHVGFVRDGHPYVLPTIHARVEDRLYLHGALASGMLRTLAKGAPACVVATLVDGLVLARAAYNHSLNYRSVVLLGTAEKVADPEEKRAAMAALVVHVVPGRMRDARPPSAAELKATRVLRLRIQEASAKVRSGPPVDEPEDLGLPVWAGELPLTLAALAPIQDPAQGGWPPVPDYLASWARGPARGAP
jgi:nitroimidazol reductase NimA-like FMN-containing flavoprotein (pyridoxamine 5'-phosphate oxidase superfamily)